MSSYKVSVVIPAYNAEKYLDRCLRSLTEQTLNDIEIIVVNDGSTDSSQSICEKMAMEHDNIKIFSKNNEGQGVARNFGIQRAQGEYIGFVDADDYVELDMFETLYSCAKKMSCDWAYSYMEGETYLKSKLFKNYEEGIVVESTAGKKRMKSLFCGGLPEDKDDSFLGMSVCRSIFRIDVIKKYGIKFISERKVNSEDLLFNLDFLKVCGDVCTVNKVFYHYCHDNPVSFSVRPNRDRYRMFTRLYSELLERTDNSEEKLRATRRFLANIRIIMVEKAKWCTKNNLRETKKEMKEILNDPKLQRILHAYPVNKLPWMQKIYFYFMRYKLVMLLIITAKLRYRIL